MSENVPPSMDTDYRAVSSGGALGDTFPRSASGVSRSIVLEEKTVNGHAVIYDGCDMEWDWLSDGSLNFGQVPEEETGGEVINESNEIEIEKIPSLNVIEVDLDLELGELDVDDFNEELNDLARNPEDTGIGKGLIPYSLKDVTLPSSRGKFDVNPDSITKHIVDATTSGKGVLGGLPDLGIEDIDWSLIVKGLVLYAHKVELSELDQLFPVKKDDEEYRPSGSKKFKSWGYVAELGRLKEVTQNPKAKREFEKTMMAIMAASLEVDPNNWTMCEVGYTLAFWIAVLYEEVKEVEVSPENKLYTGMWHFLELHNIAKEECNVRKK